MPLELNSQDLRELIQESLIPHLNEIDWEKDFPDVSKKCIEPKQLTQYLNDVLSNRAAKPVDRKKFGADMPHVHGGAIKTDEEGDIDIAAFTKNITAMPNSILSGNIKMQKSATESSISVNIGIPALRGLVYDIQNKEFYFVNTCLGAGSCATICYAKKGSYIMFADVFVKQTRILNLLLNFPDRFQTILGHELEIVCIKNPDMEIALRWNDAGDFFSKRYFDIAVNITKELTAKGYSIKSYAYTKMGDIVNADRPDNFIVNFSDDANKRQTSKVDVESAKRSVIVPRELFTDLLLKDSTNRNYLKDKNGRVQFAQHNGLAILKGRLAQKYGVDPKTIITYPQMLGIEPTKGKTYNVIVMPTGDGDLSAQRNDVQITFLLEH